MKRSAPKPEDLIGTAEAAALIGRDKSTIARMVRQGRLTGYTQPIKAKGKPALLIDRRELEALKDQVIEIEPE